MTLLTGKVCLITGAAAGIGRAMALKASEEGASLVIADIDEAVEETAQMVRDAGGDCHAVKSDVSKPKEVDALIKKVLDIHGHLDCAINNAGIEGIVAPLVDQSIENFDNIMGINARGTFLCMRDEIRAMLANGGGAIVNVASVAGLIGFAGLSPYVGSKHAINGLTKNAALEYGASGIRINSICPGGVDTRMLDSLADQATEGQQTSSELMAPLHPIGRIGKPEEIADLAIWLCSSQASFVTGAIIPVDGGFVAQ